MLVRNRHSGCFPHGFEAIQRDVLDIQDIIHQYSFDESKAPVPESGLF